MKSLPLKWIPVQVPLLKISNFSNNFMIVYIFKGCFSYFTFYMLWLFENIIFYWKSSTRIDREKIQKMFKNLTERLLLTRTVVSCIIHAIASGKALPRVVKFYQEIFLKTRFSNKSRRLLLKLPRNNQSFLIQSKVCKHYRISFYGIFSNIQCILLLPSVLIFLVLFSPHFSGLKWKCFSISVKTVMLTLLGLLFQAWKGMFLLITNKCCRKKLFLLKMFDRGNF